MDLLKVYSNHPDQVKRLRSLLNLPRVRKSDEPVRLSKRPLTRLNPDQIAELVAAYQAGGKVQELATRFGIHRFTVTRLLQQEGAHRPRGLQSDDLPEAIRLYESGWSLARLATKFDVVESTMTSALRKAGVTIRARRGWPPTQ